MPRKNLSRQRRARARELHMLAEEQYVNDVLLNPQERLTAYTGIVVSCQS